MTSYMFFAVLAARATCPKRLYGIAIVVKTPHNAPAVSLSKALPKAIFCEPDARRVL